MFNSPWIRRPDFHKLEFNYDNYWKSRGWKINEKLKPREKIMLASIPAGSRVLDMGCGNSLLPVKLTEKGCFVEVADISKLVLEGYSAYGIKGHQLDIEKPDSFSFDKKFDYMILSEVLEHTRNPEEIILSLKKYTDRFVVTIPNSASYQFRYGLMFRGRFFTQWIYHPSEHLRYWSHIDFLDWAEAMGLTVESSTPSDGFSFPWTITLATRALEKSTRVPSRLYLKSKIMKICWFGIYKKEYPRNAILMAGLRANGAEIVECHAEWNSRSRYLDLWKSLRALRGDYDLIYAGYPGTIPAILAKIVSRKPVVLDAFYSMYDAVVNDRKEIKWFHPRALKLALFDWIAILCADLVISDTETHKEYWGNWPLVRRSKVKTVYLGADTSMYHPIAHDRSGRPFIIHFHGHYIPVQGVDVIVRSAEVLREGTGVKFRFIGSGQDSDKIDKMIREKNLKNIEIIGRVSPAELNKYMNESDIVLGIFGDVPRAYRVIPNKVYEGMAVGKPMITMDSPAIREIFGDDDVLLIKNDAESLAKAIETLKNDGQLSDKIARNGFAKIESKYNPKAIGADLFKILYEFTR